MHFRIIIHAAIIMLLSATQASFAATRDEAAAAVKERFLITTPGFLGGFSEIGSVLTPRREGLRANRPSKAFRANLVTNGRLASAGGGDLPLGGVHDGAIKPGERLHLYGVQSGDDYVQLDLYTVATYVVPGSGIRGPTPLQASVRFQYEGGLDDATTLQILDDICAWLAVEGETTPASGLSRPAPAPSAAGSGTSTVRLGQSAEEVLGILGPPGRIFLLGAKTIFVYRDVKVIFLDGKVVDAE